ncbi:MAG: aspartate aminotransferase family protein [Chloroflexi bacterium]|nr:aspartate aminotransferase family protein [Chloroflexota bacterium]
MPELYRFDKSRELYARAQKMVAGGISSQIRRAELPVPLWFERAKNGLMWDVDGNEYVDYVQGMGPNIFGHAPDFIVDAVARDMRGGFVFAGQMELELEVTEMVQQSVPLKGPVRYASSGTEIDQLALRLARGYTGRPKYLKFEGHYHGWTDTVSYSVHPPLDQAGLREAPVAVPESGGIAPGSDRDIVIAPWNDLDILRSVFERQGSELACVLMEPILCNTNTILPRPGYMEGVRELCDRYGVLLIFDEVITGFRVALGGAQELLGIQPDLATYAKALAGGFPLSMMIGRPEIMELLGDGRVHHGGSFNSNVMSMSAARAGLKHILENPDRFYRELNARGNRLIEGLRQAGRETESDLQVQGLGSTFWTNFTTKDEIFDYRDHAENCDAERYQRFARAMLERGVRLSTNGRWHMASTHTDADVDRTIEVARLALRAI